MTKIKYFRAEAKKNAKERKKFWSFRAADQGVGELMLYGIIEAQTWWGDEVTPQTFKDELDSLGDISKLNVYINSDGGDVFAGQAIHSMLKRHKAHVNVYIDGIAASIASVIAMAGDTVFMPRNSMIMIHSPWTVAMGNATDFRKLADDLDAARESMIAAYQDKSGMEREELITLLEAETWLSAERAIELGFADQIENSKQIAAAVRNGALMINGQTMNLDRFKNAPMIVETEAEYTSEKVIPQEPEQKKELPNTDPEDVSNATTSPMALYERITLYNESRRKL
ncbi:Clp protease ClpP [Paenibacillus sp. EKM102P]|uniref:head maturation protease, ClpP-related n=1 Tax=unclassified Paenibacillus TaxID=185978 RepID=UPI00142E5459|nr:MULTISPECIES: head maturation protease, ClpP-related [unclassified Paenibacillus]KAF6618269.1 Clp protease ClpP [Paenibacillus sp. EKM101P]KAF6624614.1 Clp protease ClpP [Paenibacillus sp. EKM102P]KAF6635607.1 Clp protease ClpP [Paenibacillus sp. EKM10P]KAF6648683.1 Clp protease ClpP [Paenibacillus sp. EKM11P]